MVALIPVNLSSIPVGIGLPPALWLVYLIGYNLAIFVCIILIGYIMAMLNSQRFDFFRISGSIFTIDKLYETA
jgi:hypothetical protein